MFAARLIGFLALLPRTKVSGLSRERPHPLRAFAPRITPAPPEEPAPTGRTDRARLAGRSDSAYDLPAFTNQRTPEGLRMATKKKLSKKDISLAKRIEKAVIKAMKNLLDKKRPVQKRAKKSKKPKQSKAKPAKKKTKRIVKKTARKVGKKTAAKITRKIGRKG
jgi:hypothetical protein